MSPTSSQEVARSEAVHKAACEPGNFADNASPYGAEDPGSDGDSAPDLELFPISLSPPLLTCSGLISSS